MALYTLLPIVLFSLSLSTAAPLQIRSDTVKSLKGTVFTSPVDATLQVQVVAVRETNDPHFAPLDLELKDFCQIVEELTSSSKSSADAQVGAIFASVDLPKGQGLSLSEVSESLLEVTLLGMAAYASATDHNTIGVTLVQFGTPGPGDGDVSGNIEVFLRSNVRA